MFVWDGEDGLEDVEVGAWMGGSALRSRGENPWRDESWRKGIKVGMSLFFDPLLLPSTCLVVDFLLLSAQP